MTILTGYLHLSRFADGLHRGDRVRQGEIIGYVGATGLATGPHLDYRVQQGGRWIDPLSIKAVPAEPIAGASMPLFVAWRERLHGGLRDGTPVDERRARAAPGAPAAGEATWARGGRRSTAARR